ncbi:MAG: 30S ribosomal protein THX [Bacteroidales bacterium]|nr:30S ribosomal protein THX [Bacteroidales bacterium]
MGKGDQKTKKGKRTVGSYGNSRLRKAKKVTEEQKEAK